MQTNTEQDFTPEVLDPLANQMKDRILFIVGRLHTWLLPTMAPPPGWFLWAHAEGVLNTHSATTKKKKMLILDSLMRFHRTAVRSVRDVHFDDITVWNNVDGVQQH